MVDTSRFAILASGNSVWTLARDLKDGNYLRSVPVSTCRRAEKRRGRLAVDRPLRLRRARPERSAAPGRRQALHRRPRDRESAAAAGQPQQFVLAIQPHDGKVIWKTEVGIVPAGSTCTICWGYNLQPDAQPRLVYRAGSIYVDTHQGVLARLDADSGAPRLGIRLSDRRRPGPEPLLLERYMQQPEPDGGRKPALGAGETLLIKGMQSTELYRARPQPDEGALGPADRQGVAAAGRRRPRRLSGRRRDQRARPADAERSCGRRAFPAAAWTARSWCGPTASGNLTSARDLRDRPRDRASPADLPRQRPGLRRRRPAPDRPLLLAVSNRTITAYPRGPRGTGLQGRSLHGHAPATITGKEKARMNKSGIAAVALAGSLSGCAGHRARRQFFGQIHGPASRPTTSRASRSPARVSVAAKPNLLEIDLEVSAARS